eukprot:4779092-Prymnesium_polylepis.1
MDGVRTGTVRLPDHQHGQKDQHQEAHQRSRVVHHHHRVTRARALAVRPRQAADFFFEPTQHPAVLPIDGRWPMLSPEA